MKKTLTLFLLFFLFQHLTDAQENETLVTTQLTEVTISLNGASLKREATVALTQGTNVVKITGLSPSLIPSSLQISTGDEAKIISVSNLSDYITNVKQTKKTEQLTDSLEALKLKQRILKLDSDGIKIEKKLLTENINRIGKDGVSVTELQTTLPFYRTQLKQVHEKQISNENTLLKVESAIEKTTAQLQVLQRSTQSNSSTLYITLNAPVAAKTKLSLIYASTNATWIPQYDIRTKGAGSPIMINYRAMVINKTGEDWNKVNLKLTTADPTRHLSKPTLEAWGLNYNRRSHASDREGRLDAVQMLNNNIKTEEKSLTNSKLATTMVEINEVSSEFTIKDVTTILSDGVAQILDVNTFEFPADYQYYSVPKIDNNVYLMAKITNWESMNLIEGVANVYINNVYVGKSAMDFKTANDTLELFLGVDTKVIVNRVKKKDDGSQKTIGLNRRESFIYSIGVRNTNNVPINIEVIDQVPIAQESDIEVNVNEISGATHDLQSGKLIWHLTIPPSDTKKLLLDFSVKYPKNKNVNIRHTRQVLCPKFE